MPITFRSAAGQQTGGTSTLVISKPSGVQPGDVLVAFVYCNDNTQTISVPDATWTQILQDGLSDATTFDCRGQASWHVAASGDPASWTWTISPGGVAMAGSVVAYIGASNTSPINASGDTTAGNTNTSTAPSIATTVANCMLACGFGVNNSSVTWTLDASLTQRDSQSGAAASISEIAGDVLLSAAGASGAKTTTYAGVARTNVGIAVALAPGAPPELPLLGMGGPQG